MRFIVTDGVAWSVCRSVTIVSLVKTAEPIEIPFELWTLVGQRNQALDGDPDLPWEGIILRGRGQTVVKYMNTVS